VNLAANENNSAIMGETTKGMDQEALKKLSNLPEGEVVFLCDFDGTITTSEALGTLYEKFAPPIMANSEFNMRKQVVATFGAVTASKEEMEAVLDTIEVDPGFLAFLSYGKKKGYTFAIVSDGLEWYIRYILDRYDIHNIEIYANRIYFEPEGFRFEFPWFDEETPRRGVCKLKIARAYKERFDTLVFVGDGHSDVDVVEVADIIFARGWLAGYCYAKGMLDVEIFGWRDLMAKWQAKYPSIGNKSQVL